VLPERELQDVLLKLPLISLTGPWTRALSYRLLQRYPPDGKPGDPPQPLWPGGPVLKGARFTPKGSFACVYLASDAITALLEVGALFLAGSEETLVSIKTPPWVVFAVEGFLENVLDLTNPDTLRRLGTSCAELTGDWRVSQARFLRGEEPCPPTQLLGRAAYEAGRIGGILFESAKHTGRGNNLVVFWDRLLSRSARYLEVYDPDRLIVQRVPPA